ncbi:TonB-dependent receptor [Limibacter armeniacum]|uniref:SusC/RagA family TonB-linked outer membrane protein n=1 Tax=Limibacter armeniacum TaxID=466084 RepID=UPI002FE6738E
MKSKFISVFIICLALVIQVHAQSVIKGTVLDKESDTPLPGASIVPNGNSSLGSISAADGTFTLTVPEEKGEIWISFIGMEPKAVPYNGDATLTVYMEVAAHQLDEVVMIGYGSSRKEDLTSSVSSVAGVEQINNRAVTNLNDFLQGSVPGVTVLQQGGDPSAQSQIVIRGIGSFANETPLTVVDGVPYYGPAINPNDIASISILKDASAAAIYGAQAASGVIVIETKKGKLGGPEITFDTYVGVQQAGNLPTPLTAQQQSEVYNLAADNAGVERQAAHNATLNPWGQVNRTNWVDEIFREAAIYNANLNVSGASENVRYMSSVGYQKKEGVLVGTDYERLNARLKVDFFLTDKIEVGENVYFSHTNAVGTNSTSSYSGSIINAIYMPSAAPVYDENGNFHGVVPESLSDYAGAYGDVYNPVGQLLRPTVDNPVNYLNSNTYFKYDILDGLTFKSTLSASVSSSKYKKFSPKIPELGRTNLQNYLYQEYSNTNRWNWENQVTYQKSFGKHNLNLTGIYSAQKTNYESYYQEGRGFSSEAAFNQFMGNASEIFTPVTDVYEDALTSAIGRVMYNYANKYFVSASVRRDETSRLAIANQASVFPSVSGAWKISEEPFFSSNIFSHMKVRASWGRIGNINSVGYYSFDVPLSTQNVIIGEDGALNDRGVYAGRQSNPDLEWEISESSDFGFDASFLNNKVDLTFDYFVKTTKGMILPGLEDLHQGTAAPDVNGGEVQNKGIELSIGYNGQAGPVKVGVRGNINIMKNELVNLDGYNNSDIDFISHTDDVRSILRPYRSTVGQPLYATYLVPYEGIFQSQAEIDSYTKDGQLIQPNAQPGDFKFTDVNGDGSITDDDRVYMDSYMPDFTYGLNLTLGYKGFDASMIFQGVSGVKVFNGYKFTAYNASQSGYNLDNRVLDAWSVDNINADIPRLSTKDDNSNFSTPSSWYLEDASYVRLKNLTIGYTFPSIGGLKNFRVYAAGENLFTITNYSGMDPEVGGKGLDVAKYPVARTFTVGLSLTL